MIRKTVSFLLFAALALGCGRTQTAQRNDPNYQVVQEGQASGVTSTISGPGETPPPMTNTSVDTTTNFTLPDNPAPLGTAPLPATVAGTLPTTTTPPPAPPGAYPQPRPPMASGTYPAPQPPPKRRTPPPPTDTTATEQGPPATDTTATEAPPPTDTTRTDTGEKTDTTKTDTTRTDTGPPPAKPPV